MKYIFCFLLMAAITTATLGSCLSNCGVPSCKKCATTTPKPSCATKEPCPPEPKCRKCVAPTTEPPCNYHDVSEYHECEPTYTEPSCVDVEVEECPEGYAWNGYFCARSCEEKPHNPKYC
ncbi:hypothetical protein ZHAS_00019548 [Anopheles sinensis]|uniref:Uncharacterized protein n=1 Tax=Anopheles sinensis TaxID=74873 RepID=A0A084WMP7_ANOSI|nr:hypothetical protein ZHAS_00019548 [Anopheles sinensis]